MLLGARIPALCSIPGCTRPHMARTWCMLHYRRWQQTGDPLALHPHYTAKGRVHPEPYDPKRAVNYPAIPAHDPRPIYALFNESDRLRGLRDDEAYDYNPRTGRVARRG